MTTLAKGTEMSEDEDSGDEDGGDEEGSGGAGYAVSTRKAEIPSQITCEHIIINKTLRALHCISTSVTPRWHDYGYCTLKDTYECP